MINNTRLALLYYSLIDNVNYDMSNKNLLRRLGKRLDNTSLPINKEILLQAIAMYKELLAKEFETLVSKKCNGNI